MTDFIDSSHQKNKQTTKKQYFTYKKTFINSKKSNN